MRFACFNELFRDGTLDQVCACLAESGYDGIELAPFTLADLYGDVLVVGSPRQRSLLRQQGVTYDRAWDYARDFFAAVGWRT